jgi:WD40 repeat protein
VDVHPTDPRTVLSAGYDGRAILWDLATFTQTSCHYYPERNLLDCKFSKDGKYIGVFISHNSVSWALIRCHSRFDVCCYGF